MGTQKGSADKHLTSTYVLDVFSHSLGELSTCVPTNSVHTKLCALFLDGALSRSYHWNMLIDCCLILMVFTWMHMCSSSGSVLLII